MTDRQRVYSYCYQCKVAKTYCNCTIVSDHSDIDSFVCSVKSNGKLLEKAEALVNRSNLHDF